MVPSAVPPPASLQLSLFDPPQASEPPDGLPPAGTARPARPLAPSAPATPVVSSVVSSVLAPLPSFLHPRAHRELLLDEHRVGYELRRARRRTIGFTVGQEGLTVSAPRWVGLGDIEQALRAKSRWILRKLQEQRERGRRLEAARVDWAHGVELPFLGERIVVELDAAATGAVLHEAPGPGAPRRLRVALAQDAAPAQIRDLVQAWLQRQARRIFEERCAHFAPRLGVSVRRLALSSAATRWGSASADGSIRLNWRLVHFGLAVIDYVVTHELAHLREMNHGPAFWGVVRSVLPDYERAQGLLRQQVLPVFE